MLRLPTCTCLRSGKSLRCELHGGKNLNHLVHLRQFQTVVDHRLDRGYSQPPARALELRQTLYDRAYGRAVGMGHPGHVKNDSCFMRRDHPIDLSLQPRTLRSTVNAALHGERGHTWLQRSFCEMQDHGAARSSPSYGNCRISRTQSPSAEKIEGPHPHGTNEAVFWFTALSACA